MSVLQDYHTSVFYHELVNWQYLEELLSAISEQERTEAATLIVHTLDFAVVETILTHLEPADHQEFLHLCETSFTEPIILNWLGEKDGEILDKLNLTIHETKQHLYIQLIQKPTQ